MRTPILPRTTASAFVVAALLALATAPGHVVPRAYAQAGDDDVVQPEDGEDQATDQLKLLMSKARVLAAARVTAVKDCALPQTTAADVKLWIVTNRDKLAADLQASQHVFVRSELPTCAMTLLRPNADVRFSVPTCRAAVTDELQAQQTVVHESVHHFNVGQEAFARSITDAVMAADGTVTCPGNEEMLAAGSEHACFLHKGTVTCWGFDGEGQTHVPRLKNPKAVRANGWHTCALDDEGLACWGNNEMNQTLVPDLPDLKGFGVGAYHTCAIDGTKVKCWGGDWADQTVPPANLGTPVSLALGIEHSCAITDTGVKCWGRNAQTTLPAGLTNVKEIAAGDNHSCAIAGTKVVCWGDNSKHQNDVPASLAEPKAVAVGLYHSCALDRDGMKCWGSQEFGQIDVPALTDPRMIALGTHYSCAVDKVGVKCWGANAQGQTDVPPALRNLN